MSNVCVLKNLVNRTEQDTVSFTLLFGGLDTRPLQQGLIYILMTGARSLVWYGQPLKMIGPLVVSPYHVTSDLRPVNRTERPANVTYFSVTLPVFNLTLTPALSDPRSALFMNISSQFCGDMSRFYRQTSLSNLFLNCTVLGFRPKPTRIDFRIGFLGDGWPGIDESPRMVIESFAPSMYYWLWHLYKVGALQVILDQLTANGLELHTSLQVVNLTYSSALGDPGSAVSLHHSVLFCRDVEKFYLQSSYAGRFHGCGVKSFTPDPVMVHFFLTFKGTNLNSLTSSHLEVIRGFADKVSWAGWLAYRVGELLVLPEEQLHSLYPTNISIAPTPTFSPTSPSTSTTSAADAAKAVIRGDLYRLQHSVDLLNPDSQTFRQLQHHFCHDVRYSGLCTSPSCTSVNKHQTQLQQASDTTTTLQTSDTTTTQHTSDTATTQHTSDTTAQVDRVYLSSILFLTYRGCEIRSFSFFPDQVVFHLYFDTRLSDDLKHAIVYVLDTDSPKVNLTESTTQRMEVLHLGDLYLKWRLINLDPHDGMFPTPLPTLSPSSTSTTTLMSSLVTSVTSGLPDTTPAPSTPVPEKGQVPLTYLLYNFTYVPDLDNPTSDLFETLERRLCLEVQEIFKASQVFYLLYAGCSIEKFG
ncbi:hypothetical protein C0Q70_21242 [Pomacea canaliculata]|uniref:SEA domain-containing protein n=1 Tax=Pomacea canaliculata TaxID=400727 RepID=A0A2T7NC21_POMCA|nr:hypothetical protein C0Q70_21242 [Pomacea canaliculata]